MAAAALPATGTGTSGAARSRQGAVNALHVVRMAASARGRGAGWCVNAREGHEHGTSWRFWVAHVDVDVMMSGLVPFLLCPLLQGP